MIICISSTEKHLRARIMQTPIFEKCEKKWSGKMKNSKLIISNWIDISYHRKSYAKKLEYPWFMQSKNDYETDNLHKCSD